MHHDSIDHFGHNLPSVNGREREDRELRDKKMLSIVLADDCVILRRGLRVLLEAQSGWKVVAEAGTGREAVSLAAELQPDIVVLDVNMPELNGLEAARLILKSAPEMRILVLTTYHSDEMVAKALHSGVRAYLLKSDAEADLLAAVTALMRGGTFFTPAISDLVARHLKRENDKALSGGIPFSARGVNVSPRDDCESRPFSGGVGDPVVVELEQVVGRRH